MENNQFSLFPKSTAQSGFSLFEILIGLALIALIGAVVGTKVLDQFHEGRVSSATIQMQGFASALKEFRRHCNFYPTTEQGLDALISKPTSGRECRRYNSSGYIDGGEIPLDPWDNEYIYISDGKTFNIISYGEDQEEGGEGKAADISLNKQKSSNE